MLSAALILLAFVAAFLLARWIELSSWRERAVFCAERARAWNEWDAYCDEERMAGRRPNPLCQPMICHAIWK